MMVSTQELLVDLLVEGVLNAVRIGGPGQCIRIDNLPASVMASACVRVAEQLRPADQAYLVSRDRPSSSNSGTRKVVKAVCWSSSCRRTNCMQ